MDASGRERTERRLAAILAADVAGYSRLIGEDEEGTLDRLRMIRAELIDPGIAPHRGRIVKTTGDGLLVEFASVVDALRCATDWQRAMAERNAGIAPAQRIQFRIGINVGDIVVEDGDIFGDGVNVAARLEALAEPGGICVSARVQEDAAGRLDLAFDDMGEQALKNIARAVRVYRIRPTSPHPNPPPQAREGVTRAAPLHHPPSLAGEGGVGAEAPPALALPDKPSIAVLPFQNMSGDPEQEYFADGMVEEIITALSRIRWLFVIARNSSFTYKGQAVDVKQVGSEMGVRYVLEGSVRKASSRVRITAQLIEAKTGTHLWADRFDGSLEDVFELQDKIAISVAGVIEPALEAAEIRRAIRRPTNDLTAFDLYLRGLPRFASWDKEGIAEALNLFERAIERDPDYGRALAYAAHCRLQLAEGGWVEDRDANRRTAIELARRAIAVAPDDPSVLASSAGVLTYFSGDINAAIALIDRAVMLNPSSARAWNWRAWIMLGDGQPDTAIANFETSMRLTPRDRMGMSLSGIGCAHFFARRFEDAIVKLAASIEELPSYTMTYRFLASAHAHIGRLDKAREVVGRLRAMTAVVMQDAVWIRNPEHRELLLSGLRLAAGRDGIGGRL
jgi:adenylate cyclase